MKIHNNLKIYRKSGLIPYISKIILKAKKKLNVWVKKQIAKKSMKNYVKNYFN